MARLGVSDAKSFGWDKESEDDGINNWDDSLNSGLPCSDGLSGNDGPHDHVVGCPEEDQECLNWGRGVVCGADLRCAVVCHTGKR